MTAFTRLTPLLFTSNQLCMFLFHHPHHDEITIVIITVRIIMMLKSPGKKTLLRRPWRCLVSPVCFRSPPSRGNTWCDDYHYHCCYHYYDDCDNGDDDDWELPWIGSIKKLGAQSYCATTPLPQEHKSFEPGIQDVNDVDDNDDGCDDGDDSDSDNDQLICVFSSGQRFDLVQFQIIGVFKRFNLSIIKLNKQQ